LKITSKLRFSGKVVIEYLVGEKVFQLFIKDKENKSEEESFQTEIIPTKIILRESTALRVKT